MASEFKDKYSEVRPGVFVRNENPPASESMASEAIELPKVGRYDAMDAIRSADGDGYYVLASDYDAAQSLIAELRDKLSHYPAVWREDSSLKTWFPFTAEEVDRLKGQVEELRKRMATAAEAASRITAPDGDAYAQGVKKGLTEALEAVRKLQGRGQYEEFTKAEIAAAVSRLLGVGK